jgi:hypothetical protein
MRVIGPIVVALVGASCGAGEEGEGGSTAASMTSSSESSLGATDAPDGSDTIAAAESGSSSSSGSSGGATTTTAADGPEPSTSSTTVDATTMGTTDALATTGAVGDDWLEACVAEGPCDAFVLQCGLYRFGSDPECVDVAYGAALECAFEMFAEGTPGRFRYDFNGTLSGEDEWMDIVVVGDGTAVRQSSWEDPDAKDLIVEPIEECTLKPGAWFSDCAAAPVGDPLHETCFDVFEWFEDGCTTPATCP